MSKVMFRRMAAEGLGSLLLAATVIGSGIMAERLAAGNLAVALIANTGATVAVLATLIALLGPVSGAHFNPAVPTRCFRCRSFNRRFMREPVWVNGSPSSWQLSVSCWSS